MLSLVCVCIAHTGRREICSIRPRSYKGVCRYLNEDGHEFINLMPFFFTSFINIPLEIWEHYKINTIWKTFVLI